MKHSHHLPIYWVFDLILVILM